jgi:hypothetical protein
MPRLYPRFMLSNCTGTKHDGLFIIDTINKSIANIVNRNGFYSVIAIDREIYKDGVLNAMQKWVNAQVILNKIPI